MSEINLDDVLPPMYAAVLETRTQLHKEYPDGVNVNYHGVRAWESLTLRQQFESLPLILGAYVRLIHDEERQRCLQVDAEDRTHTYLEANDLAMLWDSIALNPNEDGEVPVGHESLIRALSEIELLQHRLAMRDQDGGSS